MNAGRTGRTEYWVMMLVHPGHRAWTSGEVQLVGNDQCIPVECVDDDQQGALRRLADWAATRPRDRFKLVMSTDIS